MKIKLLNYIPLSVAVFAGRTAWESYERGGVYENTTDKINKNDYNFLYTLFNNLKHWSVAEHIWYTFQIDFENYKEMFKTMFYIKNEYNFYSKLKRKNSIIFSVNLRTIFEELNAEYKGKEKVNPFYNILINHLPDIHKMLINKEKYDEQKMNNIQSMFNKNFKKIVKSNKLGHRITLFYKYECINNKTEFERRPHVFTSLYIENFSRAVLQEIVRHDDLIALTIKSSRFTLKELKKEPVINEEIAKKYLMFPPGETEEDIKIRNFEIEELKKVQKFVKEGIKNDKVKYILPESYKTKGFFTYNINNLNNLINLRTVSNTKVLWEFYELANLIAEVKKELL